VTSPQHGHSSPGSSHSVTTRATRTSQDCAGYGRSERGGALAGTGPTPVCTVLAIDPPQAEDQQAVPDLTAPARTGGNEAPG
jgi:hypothetical protein